MLQGCPNRRSFASGFQRAVKPFFLCVNADLRLLFWIYADTTEAMVMLMWAIVSETLANSLPSRLANACITAAKGGNDQLTG
jgi:hypothetical protein